jgi:hypothetical protein
MKLRSLAHIFTHTGTLDFFMLEAQIFEYPVPKGFPAMCLPTKLETRLPQADIKIVYAEEKDLEEWVCVPLREIEA